MIKVGKINIVGTKYDIIYHDNYEEINRMARERDEKYNAKKEEYGLDGWCDYIPKEIHIYSDASTNEDYFNMTLLHEISHAYLFEIGNANHDNEEIVDKLSKWIPQIYKIFINGKEKLDGIGTRNNQQDQPDQQGNNESGDGVQ
jgi:hypothetical protein